MATPYESAQLILKLYELRREPKMREARNWFVREFHPETLADVESALASDKSPLFRMVVGYWEMAASLVNHGAIDRQMFLDSTGEAVGTFAKIEPVLAAYRQLRNQPDTLAHLERLVRSIPDIGPRLEELRTLFRGGRPKSGPAG